MENYMPTELAWYEPEQIILLRAEGDMSLQEMRNLFNDAAGLLDGLDHTVNFIFDGRTLGKLPWTSVNQLEASYQLIRHRNFGWLGMVGVTAAISFWLRMFSKLMGLRYTKFETIEEAAGFLRELEQV
jgi:hypothetical protein